MHSAGAVTDCWVLATLEEQVAKVQQALATETEMKVGASQCIQPLLSIECIQLLLSIECIQLLLSIECIQVRMERVAEQIHTLGILRHVVKSFALSPAVALEDAMVQWKQLLGSRNQHAAAMDHLKEQLEKVSHELYEEKKRNVMETQQDTSRGRAASVGISPMGTTGTTKLQTRTRGLSPPKRIEPKGEPALVFEL